MVQRFKERFLEIGDRPTIFDVEYVHHYIMICDYGWYADKEQEIIKWMSECLTEYHIQGMTIGFVSKQDLLMFKLRWFN